MLGKINTHIKGKNAGLGTKSSLHLPCKVFADIVFSSVLSDKFCFCQKTRLFNEQFVTYPENYLILDI